MQNRNYKNYKKIRKKCLCCGNKNLSEILDLGLHSFADRFIKPMDLKKKDPVYPLVLDLCKDCKFIQSRFITNPKDRYYNYDYSYTSSNSNYSINHWSEYADFLNKKYLLESKKVLEIGSNDGLLSQFFDKYKANVTCVDASPFMSKLSKKRGLYSINSIFSFKESKKIKKKIGCQDIIVANNVFNHSDNPKNFLNGVKNILKKNGIFIFEQPYFFDTLTNKRFDQIYHEHISYFTAYNIENLLNICGFQVLNLLKNGYHGGSIRTIAILTNDKFSKNQKVLKLFKNKESKFGIYKDIFFKKYTKTIKYRKKKLQYKINKFKSQGYLIYGIGAGAKTNTYLTYNDLNSKNIDGITETSKFKIGKYTPLTRIKIYKDNKIKNLKKIVCLIFSWNIQKILKKKLKLVNTNIKYIKT